MSSDNESTAGRSSTGNEHIDDVMKALRHNNRQAPALKSYLRATRWIPLAIHPYANLTAVFLTGLEQEPEDEEDVQELSEIDKVEEKFIFAEILKLLPTFKPLFTACCGHRQALLNLIHMVQDTANGARNDGVTKTNASIVDYLIPLSPKYLTYRKGVVLTSVRV